MLGRFFCGTNISENLHFSRLKGVRWIYEIENGLDEGWSVRKPKNEWLEGPSVDILLYCTISIDSAWGVTCDQMDDILTTSNVGVTWDKV